MPLNISTTNTAGLELSAIVDKVDDDGAELSPAIRWSVAEGSFFEKEAMLFSEGLVPLVESAAPGGFYSVDMPAIDGLTEKLRITIINNEDESAIGTYVSIPVESFVAPEVTIDLTVTEDRN
jgi:hypothetical protein